MDPFKANLNLDNVWNLKGKQVYFNSKLFALLLFFLLLWIFPEFWVDFLEIHFCKNTKWCQHYYLEMISEQLILVNFSPLQASSFCFLLHLLFSACLPTKPSALLSFDYIIIMINLSSGVLSKEEGNF